MIKSQNLFEKPDDMYHAGDRSHMDVCREGGREEDDCKTIII